MFVSSFNAVNDYVAGISYRPGIVNCSIPSYGVVSGNNDPLVDDYTIEHLLRRITPTGWPKKVSHHQFFKKIALKIANEIIFLRKVKV